MHKVKPAQHLTEKIFCFVITINEPILPTSNQLFDGMYAKEFTDFAV